MINTKDQQGSETVKIIEAQQAHIPGMVQCHIKSFPGRFMTEMGHYWLCSLYRFFINHHRSICRVAVDVDGQIIGLAVGGNPHIREEFLKSALFRYPHIIFWKFLSKRLVRRVLLQELTRKLLRKHTTENSVNIKTPSVRIRSGNLLSICVVHDCEGTGFGGKLIESFQLTCKTEGYEQLTLSVLKENNHAAAFYKKHGWRQSGVSGDSIMFVLDL
jgi:ribosomal protein S18 acetylase RimI-like enzyme